MAKESIFSTLFDRLVNPGYKHDQETLYKARILAGIVSAYLVLLFLTNVYLLGFAPVPWNNALVSALLVTAMMGGYLYVLYVLRFGSNYRLCIEFTVLSSFIGIAAGISMSGGPMDAPATPILIVPIILAFCLSSRHSGMIWALITLTTHLALVVIDKMVYPFPQMLDTRQMLTHHIVHWAIAYFAIIALMMIFGSITHRLKEERDAERNRYAHLAAHDPLTGLANRSMFDEQLVRAVASCHRTGASAGLLFIDLDGFKPINDKLGHDTGDRVLKEIASRMHNLLRKTDTIARMGGDEFAVITENVKSPPGVEVVAQRIIEEINRPYDFIPHNMHVGASIGIAIYPDHTDDLEKLRIYADKAMYSAKDERNCWQLYNSGLEYVKR